MTYTIKQLADLSGITIRTLHYYDEIGLLKPEFVHDNGYRYYGDKQLKQLQHILFFRELEFPLNTINELLHSQHFDERKALSDQKRLLEIKKQKLEKLLQIINRSMKGGEKIMKPKQIFDPFRDEHYLKYKEEVEERWGKTDAYQQSMERMKKWTKEDFEGIKKEGGEITLEIAAQMEKGVKDPNVQKAVRRHFDHINRFYDCSLDMYKNLGQMYVDDHRFSAFYEKVKPGLAVFMKDAMQFFSENNK